MRSCCSGGRKSGARRDSWQAALLLSLIKPVEVDGNMLSRHKDTLQGYLWLSVILVVCGVGVYYAI